MSGRIDFTVGFKRAGESHERNSDGCYRIYVLGNFSGRTSVPLGLRKIIPVTLDEFERVMAQVEPTFEWESGLRLRFQALEDFHPDVWLPKVPIIADLLALKRELSNPVTADKAAAKIQAFLPADEAGKEDALETQAPDETEAEMLERLLGRKPESTMLQAQSVDRLIERIVSPHISPTVQVRHQRLLGLIDTAISQYLRIILRQPGFQALESLWRATAGLLNEDFADEQSVFLVDISQAELLADVQSGGQGLRQKLLQHLQTGDGEREVLLIGDYRFSAGESDVELLGLCGRLANACGGHFLAAADASLIENAILPAAGQAEKRNLVQGINAGSVILAYPRYLLRLPYGEKRDPLETLAFEECSAVPHVDELSWGNPAFLCARALVRVCRAENAQEEALFFADIPGFAFTKDDERILQPGTETVLTEAQANALLSQGIMPLIGYHRQQGVRLLAISPLSYH